jgi:hypothetical protein
LLFAVSNPPGVAYPELFEGGQEQPEHRCHRRQNHVFLNLRDVFNERAPKPAQETFTSRKTDDRQKKFRDCGSSSVRPISDDLSVITT